MCSADWTVNYLCVAGGVYAQTQAAMAYGMAGAPAAAIPNGMMHGTQVVQVLLSRCSQVCFLDITYLGIPWLFWNLGLLVVYLKQLKLTNSIRGTRSLLLLLLWNPKFHYHLHKSPLLNCVLSQLNPAQMFTLFH
jgi:hypothetical protein